MVYSLDDKALIIKYQHMKTNYAILLLFSGLLLSCSSVSVSADYDKNVNFEQFKTYAYDKKGIDKVELSDLDKKRILRAIDAEMALKGFTKSENPDLLINIFTLARERVDVNQFNAGWGYGWGWGWGWNPWMWGGGMNTSVSKRIEGTLYIDLIDAKKKELIWQGVGEGILTQNVNKKEERITEFVKKILAKYPPEIKK